MTNLAGTSNAVPLGPRNIERAPSAISRPDLTSGSTRMVDLVRSFDWASTPLGPMETWPESFRTMSGVVLASLFPMLIWWGPELRHFYNDGYRPMLGAKHPASMGQPASEVWAEIWDIVGPRALQVLHGGPSTFDEDLHLPMDRYGFVEETYFTFSYSPIPEPSAANGVGGVLVTVTETTARVLGERRVRALRDLGARAAEARSAEEACAIAIQTLGAHSHDIPFALLYVVDGDEARLVARTDGVSRLEAPPEAWMIDRVLATGTPLTIDDVDARVGEIPAAPWPEPVRKALAVPIPSTSANQPAGVLVAGLSPRLAVNDGYADFIEVAASQIGIAITNARAYESERKRAESLAELDRAKTVFFSNISHEFRTPLTLLLGPTEEALRAGASGEAVLHGEDLHVVHRNALRMLRLVNALLDFSRIEAGRLEARFEPTNVAALTAELASSFRSAIERAGLRLVVETSGHAEDAYIDHSMWEKIVLNLLSNAFKHTFRGEIGVTVSVKEGHWVLEVRDTGIGIPSEQLPHIFERFYRVPNAQSRTHEGTGIGLSLVHELVKLHGGTMRVASVVGEGTTFTVSIPTGKAHLPEDHVVPRAARSQALVDTESSALVESALSWLPSAGENGPSDTSAEDASGRLAYFGAHILVADDNADMRQYVARLLRDEGWFVETVANGRAALEAARRKAPDVLLTDVMMPELGGFELLKAIREDERTRAIPVVMLTARSGEDARIEGMRAGADDYLVKPFASRELVARLGAQIRRVRDAAAKRKRQEDQERLFAAIETERERLRDLFAQAPAAIAVFRGPDHVFEIANAQYMKFVGHRTVIGKPIREALPELEGQGIFELLDQVYSTRTPVVGTEYRVVLDNRGAGEPEEHFFNFVYQPIREADGTVSGTFVHAMDVTDLVHAKHDAEAARASAEDANKAKSAFLAAMSHELRTPLNAIAGYAQLLDLEVHGALNESQHDALHRIQRSEQHLLSLINDVLNFAKLEAGHVEYAIENVSLSAVTTEVLQMMEPQIDAKGLAFEMRSRPDAIARADRDKVRQIVLNLLSNAVKFTERGGRLVLETAVSEVSEETVSLTVSDTGIGIPREKQEAIFDPFVQVHRNLTRVTEGTGLGLAISRDLARGMGGDLRVQSEEGKGSTFRLELPRVQLAPV